MGLFLGNNKLRAVEGGRGGAQKASWGVMLTRLRRTSMESGVSIRLRCRGIPTRVRFS